MATHTNLQKHLVLSAVAHSFSVSV